MIMWSDGLDSSLSVSLHCTAHSHRWEPAQHGEGKEVSVFLSHSWINIFSEKKLLISKTLPRL